MEQELKDVLDTYYRLVPPRDEGMVIFWLNDKIQKKEIDRSFTYQDIERAIKETSSWEGPGHVPHSERVLKDLLHYFIERPADRRDRYKLTTYAYNFLKLIQNKLNNPYKTFPLRDSFKRYAVFKSFDIKTIQHFESWFAQGFDTTTKQTILDHLEALRDQIEVSINDLNGILYSTDAKVLETVVRFGNAFKAFGEKSEEIKDALTLETKLETEIVKVVQMFYDKIETSKHPETQLEIAAHEQTKSDYTRSAEIQREVKQFFEIVDEKLAQLNLRILFSSTKLTELQDNFKYQTNFKLNIKRFLKFTLQQATHNRDGIMLPENFPRMKIPYESFRLMVVPEYKFFVAPQNKVLAPREDPSYIRKQRAEIERELRRQESTVKLLKKYKLLLQTEGELDFTKHFYDIMEAEDDVETALQVAFELFQFASRTSKKYVIKIDQQLTKEFNTKNIALWRLMIQQRTV